jgi:serine/threonine protein kinase
VSTRNNDFGTRSQKGVIVVGVQERCTGPHGSPGCPCLHGTACDMGSQCDDTFLCVSSAPSATTGVSIGTSTTALASTSGQVVGSDDSSSSSGKGLDAGAITGIAAGIAGVLAATVIPFIIYWMQKADEKNGSSGEVDVELGPVFPDWVEDHAKVTDVAVVKIVGKGEFGAVYRGKHEGKSVAIKALESLDEATAKEILQEYQLHDELDHKNVVKVIGLCMLENEMVGMVMHFCARGSLKDYLEQNTDDLTSVDVAGLSRDTAAGLAYLHSKNVVHQDLACRNILLETSNSTSHNLHQQAPALIGKIADFGLSCELDSNALYARVSSFAFRWSAPETLVDRKVSKHSDCYMLAITLHEIYSDGQMPYRECGTSEAVTVVVSQGKRMDRPFGHVRCPTGTWNLMQRLWTDGPRSRPASSKARDELAATLRALIAGDDDRSSDQDSGPGSCATDDLGRKAVISKYVASDASHYSKTPGDADSDSFGPATGASGFSPGQTHQENSTLPADERHSSSSNASHSLESLRNTSSSSAEVSDSTSSSSYHSGTELSD